MTNDEKLKEHVRWCPIGWHRGALKLHRATTEADVIAWIQELERLVGVHQDGAATETRLPRASAWRAEAESNALASRVEAEGFTLGTAAHITPGAGSSRVLVTPDDRVAIYLLEVFDVGINRSGSFGARHAVWLHVLRSGGYRWRCTCGAERASAVLDAVLLAEARTHFEQPWEPAAVPIGNPMAVWNDRVAGDPPPITADLERLATEFVGEGPIVGGQLRGAIVNRCGICGQAFEIRPDDPHWSTGRGPLCPGKV